MVLRLDDTDVERNTEASVQSIFEGLRWLGLDWDEEYKQSERLALHRQAAEAIFAKGLAYRDFTPAHAAGDRSFFRAGRMALQPRHARTATGRERPPRRCGRAVRAALSRAARRWTGRCNLSMGFMARRQKLADEVEDFALLRSDGMPTYHLASCVDDADLRISHIIRGQDHLTNTFKHLLIFEGLGVAAAAVRASAAAGGARRQPSSPSASMARLSASLRIAMPAFCRRPSSTFSACWAGRPRTTASFSLSTRFAPHSRSRASTAPTPSSTSQKMTPLMRRPSG